MTPRLRLYDRLRGEVAAVEPSTPGLLRVYSCGPTVYGRIHIGNARPYWTAMVLKRTCEQLLDLPVRLAINITDVNDKIYVAAASQGVPSAELARSMSDAYKADTDALGLGRPDAEPLASETIAAIVELIERLIARGAAYATADGDVYFSVSAYPGYGELSGQRPEELIAGSRVEPGEGKRAPLDFALWKATKPDEDTAWDSPWGRGRPGWHIECSAMAHVELGDDFDVHGGGLDLIFPHHENERAQSEAAGERFARVWMHNGMLRLSGEKMSKSEGNIEGLAEALERAGRETLLVFFAQAHYRSPVDYSDAALEQAGAAAAGLREALRNARRYAAAATGGDAALSGQAEAGFARFAGHMADDLNTPRALAELHGLARALNTATAGRQPIRGRSPRPQTCSSARSTSSGSPRSGASARPRRRRSRSPSSAPRRARPATTRSPTSCAIASRRSASACATHRRGRRSCCSMADRGSEAAPRTDLVYGLQPVREALRGRRRVREVVCTREAAEAMPWIEASGVRMSLAVADRVTALAERPDHQGVVALCDPYPYAVAEELLARPDALVVALDGVTDPATSVHAGHHPGPAGRVHAGPAGLYQVAAGHGRHSAGGGHRLAVGAGLAYLSDRSGGALAGPVRSADGAAGAGRRSGRQRPGKCS